MIEREFEVSFLSELNEWVNDIYLESVGIWTFRYEPPCSNLMLQGPRKFQTFLSCDNEGYIWGETDALGWRA